MSTFVIGLGKLYRNIIPLTYLSKETGSFLNTEMCFIWLGCPQRVVQFLTPSRYSLTVCWMNEWTDGRWMNGQAGG